MSMPTSIPVSTLCYVLTPPEKVTGGPEFCNQICKELNSYPNITAKLLYITKNSLSPHPDIYQKKYLNHYVINHKPEPDSIIFIPEAWASYLNYPLFKDCKYKFLVWMSVNNYFDTLPVKEINLFPSNTYHLYQGEYSKDYLLSFAKVKKEKMFPLIDYVGEEYLKEGIKQEIREKKNIIAFQMNKTTSFFNNILQELRNRELEDKIGLFPIENMTSEQIITRLNKSKIFLHLGWNPGIDRMPREAVLLDNCIISSTLGSGKYYEDMMIPSEYKFDITEDISVIKIANKIQECLDNYEERIKDFKLYKTVVLGQKDKFKSDIERIVRFINSGKRD